MMKKRSRRPSSAGSGPKDFAAFSKETLQSIHGDEPLAGFLRQATLRFLEFFACKAVELKVKQGDHCLRCNARRRRGGGFAVETRQEACPDEGAAACAGLCWDRTEEPSRLLLPLVAGGETIGLLQLDGRKEGSAPEAERAAYQGLVESLSLALVSRLAHAALRERVKELTCLYQLAQLAERPGITAEELFRGIAELLPPAWQYPEIAAARIVLDGTAYASAAFGRFAHRQSAAIVVGGRQRGSIEVVYREPRPELDEGPFLEEERSLIGAVARQVAAIVERRQAAEDEMRLQDQLRHADRLATIGQLAAGVAHELNEPLGNILAFAQLAEKNPGLPSQAADDLGKIVAASLHAREVIKKLMLFARQMPPRKTLVDLNGVVEEGLGFLESRCVKNSVVLRRRLSPRAPPITADPAQLYQVLVNLAVNAVQAMPEGGTLKVATAAAGGSAVLTVEDTGVGMTQEVLSRIFTPFFTTKDVHEGTGLGLPVVHGIVTSHGGTITVSSRPGRGTRFEIRLPLASSGDAPADEDSEAGRGPLRRCRP